MLMNDRPDVMQWGWQ